MVILSQPEQRRQLKARNQPFGSKAEDSRCHLACFLFFNVLMFDISEQVLDQLLAWKLSQMDKDFFAGNLAPVFLAYNPVKTFLDQGDQGALFVRHVFV